MFPNAFLNAPLIPNISNLPKGTTMLLEEDMNIDIYGDNCIKGSEIVEKF